MKGKILIIAGSDSGGGAGIQADVKTVTALGGYAATAITALTAQNTLGVQAVEKVSPDFVYSQIEAVLSDIGADVIKTGMLNTRKVILKTAQALENFARGKKLVVDPVMVAKGGAPLLKEKAVDTLKEKLIPMATLVTPNIPEAEILAGMKIKSVGDMEKAGQKILALGAENVLIKGGHMKGSKITDLLISKNGTVKFTSKKIKTKNTHGTGCTLASAIATFLAQGDALETAVEQAREYVHTAIRKAPKIGHGHGPLNHIHD